MSGVRLTGGEDFEEEAAKRFVDAWHRAEKGEPVNERHFYRQPNAEVLKILEKAGVGNPPREDDLIE